MTMTLQEVLAVLDDWHIREDKTLSNADAQRMVDAIDFHLSQPQPVAQGEAVGSSGLHCGCPACRGGKVHASDCAVHNIPYKPNGDCDCKDEPVAWISTVKCIGPDYGKKYYDSLPIQSLQVGYYEHTPLYAASNIPAGHRIVPVEPKLIGWRTADYTAETADPDKAKNWSSNVAVLPIFEGDPNTNLNAAPTGGG